MTHQETKTNDPIYLLNHHCSVVEIEKVGIIIEGKSGTGKTSLALGLIESFSKIGKSATLVSDDQVFLDIVDEELICHTPSSIAGKAELYGYGIINVPYKPYCKVGLLIELVDDQIIERLPENKISKLHNIELPYLQLPERHEEQSIRIIKEWFKK